MSTITVTPTVEDLNYPPRIRLDVVDSGLPSYAETTVLRVDSTGRTSPVRTANGEPLTLSASGSDRVGLIYDYEVPYGSPVFYSTLEDSATVSGQVVLAETRVWLVHPGVPELSMPIELRAGSLQTEEWAVSEGVFWPMGREFPVVHTDGQRKAASSSLIVGVESLTSLARLRALLHNAGVLLLNIPETLGMGFDTCYISVGAVRSAHRTGVGGDPYRDVELPFRVVDRPAGGTQAERQYADLLSFATYAALRDAYGTYQDLLSGP